jgi:Flp pilus assembly protein TadB
MRAPLLKIAAVGLVGIALWKVAGFVLFPLVGLLFKIALVVAIVMFVVWFFRKKKDEEKPAES